jgi:hypothetical protein
VKDAAAVPTSSKFWVREVPTGVDLAAWRVQVIYPIDAEGEGGEGEEGEGDGFDDGPEGPRLEWIEGFVIEAHRQPADGQLLLRIFFPADSFDDYFTVPDLDVAFHTAGSSARVAARDARAAQNIVREDAA